MIFDTLNESAGRVLTLSNGDTIRETHLITGGLCHCHLRKDGQLTIREIIATRQGAGREMLETLKLVVGATSLFAKCPVEYASNAWYKRRGFILEGTEQTRTGRILNQWRLPL